MAIDISKIIENKPIKNGSIVISTKVTGSTNKDFLNTYVKNTPDITSIETRYETRFDDPSYYYGGTGGTGLDPNVTIIGG
jgi:hypothetical protein